MRGIRVGLQPLENLPAVKLRHGKVDHDQIRQWVSAGESQAFRSVSGLADVILRAGQQDTQKLSVIVVIFGDENRSSHRTGFSSSALLRVQNKIPDDPAQTKTPSKNEVLTPS